MEGTRPTPASDEGTRPTPASAEAEPRLSVHLGTAWPGALGSVQAAAGPGMPPERRALANKSEAAANARPERPNKRVQPVLVQGGPRARLAALAGSSASSRATKGVTVQFLM